MTTPEDLRYTTSHEWIRKEENGILTVGITDHAQCLLGDIVFIELPAVHKQLEAGKEAAVVESVKAAADVYSPLSGEVVAVNPALANNPELVNTSPYAEGWMFQLRPQQAEDYDALMQAGEYTRHIAE